MAVSDYGPDAPIVQQQRDAGPTTVKTVPNSGVITTAPVTEGFGGVNTFGPDAPSVKASQDKAAKDQADAQKAVADARAAAEKAAIDAATAANATSVRLATDAASGVQLPDLTPITAPTLGTSGVDLTLADPNAGKIINQGQLTSTEQKLRSGLIVDTLNPLTAANQEARSALSQESAKNGLAPEVKTAVYNNLLGTQSATVLDQVTDINNKAYGWVKDREDKQQAINTESFYTILKAAIGTEGMQAALQYGADLGVDPTLLKAIAENPKAWETIADANRLALEQANIENTKLYFEQNFDDYDDPEQVQANFAGWLNSRWNADTDGFWRRLPWQT
jgi:hypothetical protein